IDDPDECRFRLFGGDAKRSGREFEPAQSAADPWNAIEDRSALCKEAARRTPPWKRVGLVCDAGLGKTTNLEWLGGRIAGQKGGQQVPLLLQLDHSLDLEALVKEHSDGYGLLNRLAGLMQQSKVCGERARLLQAIRRLQASGRITLLIDGLDHILGDQKMFEI